MITRRKATKEQNTTVTKIRNEPLTQDPAFDLFETEIPEAAKIAEAFAKRMCTFHGKWGPAIITVLENLSDEAREALNAA